jgi:Rps23 Pro-64 3,4-dihydroxylase Tpa1-like proline 4-hydroxylase
VSLIRPAVLADRESYAVAYRTAKPFRHIAIDNFLSDDVARSMLADFPSFENRYALNEMGEVGGKAVRMDVRDLSATYRQIDAYLQTSEFLDFVSTVTGIPDLLYDPDYIGGGTHENRDGQGLDQHVDFNFHPGTRWHRRLNLIVYLNPEWDLQWGGNLQLQADPWNGNTSGPTIAPLFNRAVVFETTEFSWHGFSTIHLPESKKSLSRKSFAIYLYTKERPTTETAASHATVYVPEGMPAGLTSGVTLDDARIADLRGRFERMLGQLKFLYDREKQFAEQIDNANRALAESRRAQKADLQGYAIQNGAEGLWPDGWATREFVLRFTPKRRARRIDLDLWVPSQLHGKQRLVIALGGRNYEHFIEPGSRGRAELKFDGAANVEQQLRIVADQVWQPSADGSSSDQRLLAFKLVGAELVH